MANGLTGVDFVRCWITWSILPLSQHPDLMCEYTGDSKDPQQHTNIELTDALGSFFIHHIDNDPDQEDAEASRAEDVEVIIISSGSDPQPTQKTRQANEKVKFSHPLAYSDPHFLLRT